MGREDLSIPWLESPNGQRTLLRETCQIGRGPNNTLTLPSEKISRRHAMIHEQGQNEFWLIDLGSANGTYLNGRRVSQPTKLHDSDVIAVGDHRFQFFHPEQSRPTEIDSANKTIQEIRNLTLWLLVADVEGATELAKRASDDQAARVMGRWLAECKQVIDDNDGTINKFLGDGFFAYWTESEGRAAVVARTLEHFKKMQEKGDPRFRTVLHYGKVFVGGGATMGEESLIGTEVNFLFRVEKVAARLGVLRFISEAAHKEISSQLQTQLAGRHAVPSFEGEFVFFTF